MSKAETFLRRQRNTKVAGPTSLIQSRSPVSEQVGQCADAPDPQPAVPVFGGSGVAFPASPRRKWPGVVGGVLGGILILGVVGQRMDSSGKAAVSSSSASDAQAIEDVKGELERYFSVDRGKVRYWFNQVLISPHVVGNEKYFNCAKGIALNYEKDNSIVNAFAHFKDDERRTPCITVCGGIILFSRLASLAAAAQVRRKDGSFVRFLRALRPKDCDVMDGERAVELIRRLGLLSGQDAQSTGDILIQAEAISDGMMIGVLAHELGHHAFSHLSGEKGTSPISRNQEREADSFASSVIEASSSRQQFLQGTLIWHYALAQMEEANSATATTHPASRERYEDFIQRNANVAHSLGIEE